MPLLDTARGEFDALVWMNITLMIVRWLKIGQWLVFFSSLFRTSILVFNYATLLIKSLSLLCGPCCSLLAVAAAVSGGATVGATVSRSEAAEAASSGLTSDDLCSGVGTCTEHFSYICVREALNWAVQRGCISSLAMADCWPETELVDFPGSEW